MTRGWFDLFRDDGGPTLYAYSNRTSVIGDSTSITLYIVFATLFIAFFVVFPGIRKEVILSDQPYSNVNKFYCVMSRFNETCCSYSLSLILAIYNVSKRHP